MAGNNGYSTSNNKAITEPEPEPEPESIPSTHSLCIDESPPCVTTDRAHETRQNAMDDELTTTPPRTRGHSEGAKR